MRRLLALILLLALACGCATAGEPFFRIPEVLVVRMGNSVSISYRQEDCCSKMPAGICWRKRKQPPEPPAEKLC